MCVEQLACLVAHQAGGFDVHISFGDRKLNALVLADRPAGHHALVDVLGHFVDEPVAIAYTYGGDQRALRIQAVKNVLDAFCGGGGRGGGGGGRGGGGRGGGGGGGRV